MHELSITEHLLEDCIRSAEKNHASRIRVIHLCIGQLRGIVPDCIQIYLDMLSEGTIAEGAQIKAEFPACQSFMQRLRERRGDHSSPSAVSPLRKSAAEASVRERILH